MNAHRISRRWLLRAAGRAAALASTGAGGAVLAALAEQSQPSAPRSRLIVRSANPQDFETPVEALTSWITPNDLFFVRSHLPAPARADLDAWTLDVGGAVDRPLTLRFADLQAIARASAVVTLECAGNGRAFFDPAVAGIQWRRGAVGNARWTGVRLSDVLNRAGIRAAGRFVTLDGSDRTIGKVPDFVRSLPIDKAMDRDTLLVFEMNGEPLPLAHGFPLRAIVPGWEAAYSVKWLTGIAVLENEHDGFFVQTAYRYPAKPVERGATVDVKDTEPLRGMPVKSILTTPIDGARIAEGRVVVSGFAWSGEREIDRVEVSTDGGRVWQRARLGADRAPRAWRQFQFDWQVTEPGTYVVVSRATDDAGLTQPLEPAWNPSGYLWNAIDRVRVSTVSNASAGGGTAPGDRLPPGPAAALTQQKCTGCHGADIIVQQRLDEAGWGREIDKMMRWGANLSAEERARLVEYLAAQLPPRP